MKTMKAPTAKCDECSNGIVRYPEPREYRGMTCAACLDLASERFDREMIGLGARNRPLCDYPRTLALWKVML